MDLGHYLLAGKVLPQLCFGDRAGETDKKRDDTTSNKRTATFSTHRCTHCSVRVLSGPRSRSRQPVEPCITTKTGFSTIDRLSMVWIYLVNDGESESLKL